MTELFLADDSLYGIYQKLINGYRLNVQDGLNLYNSFDLLGIGKLADYVRRQKNGDNAYFIYNQHINYTNICSNKCRFCAFSKESVNENGAYTYSLDDIKSKIIERSNEPITEYHIVGGLNHKLPFSYYIDVLKTINNHAPNAIIKAFTAVEIDHMSKISGLSLENTLNILKESGLSMTPGGGAEILNSRIRDTLFPDKIGGDRWLKVMRKIHEAGIVSNATMLYGHIETPLEKIQHLMTLRELQDETGGFSAFIPLAFHSENTELDNLPSTTAVEDLKNIAISRLILDNFPHIKSYWVMLGEKLAQTGLSFGADDLDGTIIEEKISHSAGAKSAKGLTRDQMIHMIHKAGFTPIERDSFYNEISRY